MSVENLTYGEYYYFRTDPNYKQDILSQLKDLGLCLCVPSLDEGTPSISAFMGFMNKVKGSATGRSEPRRWKTWQRKGSIKNLAEVYV